MKKRKVLFITGSRSDFYIQKPILLEAAKSPMLEPLLIVSGSHLSKKFGLTLKEIKKEKKIKIIAIIKNLKVSDEKISRLKTMSNQLSKIINLVKKISPDIIISPFDREESISIALVGVYLRIPIAHLGAGDKTEYNLDGIIRHSVTKLSNFSLCFTKQNSERVKKMGEEKSRVFTVGHTAVERYKKANIISLSNLSKFLRLDLKKENHMILFIQHPVSNWLDKTKEHIKTSFRAIDELNLPTIIIRSNSDPGTLIIQKEFQNFKFKNKKVRFYENIEENLFINIVKNASVLLGNSSMGVLEAPSLNLPVVNIGERQKGRQNAGNIIFVPHDKKKIILGVKKILKNINLKKKFKNIYNSSMASKKIVKILTKIKLDDKLLNKKITY